MRGLVCCLATAASFALAGAPAAAVDDVTGTYEGKMTCNEIADGFPGKSKRDVTVAVIEEMGEIILDILAGEDEVGTALRGFVADDSAKAKRGKLTALQCGLSVGNRNGAVIHADVRIKPGSEKGKLKGTVILMETATGTAALCKISAKRTTIDPGTVTLCL